MISEEWRPIGELPLGYEVSNFGNVRLRYNNGTVESCKLQLSTDGYKILGACGQQLRMHTVVARAFLPPPKSEDMIVNHKDRNKSNNYVDNLEWVTVSENIMHKYRTGHAKTIRCVETDEMYGTIATAALLTGIPREAIRYSIVAKTSCFGYHFEYAPYVNRPDTKYISGDDMAKIGERYATVEEARDAVRSKYI